MAYTIQLSQAKGIGHLTDVIRRRTEEDGYHIGEFKIDGTKIELRRIRSISLSGSHLFNLTQTEWVSFNALINTILDDEAVVADVWSTPFDHKGRLWIRRAA